MATFDDYLRTGRIGQLTTGMTRETVRDLLGDPEDTSVSKHPEIWKYGPIELAFYRVNGDSMPRLTSTIFHFGPTAAELPETLRLSGWMPTAGTNIEEFRAHLAEVGITIFGGVTSGPHQHLVLDSSLRVTFDEGSLSSVGYTAKNREQGLKQLSISLRGDELQSIHREAKTRGLSASALCSQWISEHVSSLKAQEA